MLKKDQVNLSVIITCTSVTSKKGMKKKKEKRDSSTKNSKYKFFVITVTNLCDILGTQKDKFKTVPTVSPPHTMKFE